MASSIFCSSVAAKSVRELWTSKNSAWNNCLASASFEMQIASSVGEKEKKRDSLRGVHYSWFNRRCFDSRCLNIFHLQTLARRVSRSLWILFCHEYQMCESERKVATRSSAHRRASCKERISGYSASSPLEKLSRISLFFRKIIPFFTVRNPAGAPDARFNERESADLLAANKRFLALCTTRKISRIQCPFMYCMMYHPTESLSPSPSHSIDR